MKLNLQPLSVTFFIENVITFKLGKNAKFEFLKTFLFKRKNYNAK